MPTISKGSYFLLGLGIGSAIAILIAPKSGQDTREYMSQKAREGSEYAKERAWALKKKAEDIIQRSMDVVTQKQKLVAAAISRVTSSAFRTKIWCSLGVRSPSSERIFTRA